MYQNNTSSGILVSICCVAYNHKAFIGETLEGFLGQKTGFQYEVIIHDDASTDGTKDIIREYTVKYPDLIRPIFQEKNQYSQGVNIFETFIAPCVRGKYIAICEGDDYWNDPEKLQRQVDILEKRSTCVACVHQTIQILPGDEVGKTISPYEKDCLVDIRTILSGGNKAFQLSSLMFRSKILEKVPDLFKPSNGTWDYALSIFLGLSGDIYYIARPMSVYRLFSSENSWTSRVRRDRKKWIQHCCYIIELLNQVDKYSERKFHGTIVHEILKFEYDIKKRSYDPIIYSNSKYRKLWEKESRKEKIYFIFKSILPDTIKNFIKELKG